MAIPYARRILSGFYFFSSHVIGKAEFSVSEALAFLISARCWSADRNYCSWKLWILPSLILNLNQFTLQCLPIFSSSNFHRKRGLRLMFLGRLRESRIDIIWFVCDGVRRRRRCYLILLMMCPMYLSLLVKIFRYSVKLFSYSLNSAHPYKLF